MHKSQRLRIIAKLKRDGTVSRNECLSQFPAITRLGAIICSLKKKGWKFTTNDTGKDYVYTWIRPPKKEIVIIEKNGEYLAREIIHNKLL